MQLCTFTRYTIVELCDFWSCPYFLQGVTQLTQITFSMEALMFTGHLGKTELDAVALAIAVRKHKCRYFNSSAFGHNDPNQANGKSYTRYVQKTGTDYLSHGWFVRNLSRHSDVIMSAMASPITSLTIVYKTVYSDQSRSMQIKENIKAPRHWSLWGEFTGDR